MLFLSNPMDICARFCSRVDHLYAFFVQWSPDVYGKEAREQGFVVVEKDELDMIDNFFSDPASCSWEVSSVEKEMAPWFQSSISPEPVCH